MSTEEHPETWPLVRRIVPLEEHTVGRRFDHHWGRTLLAAESFAFSTQMLAFQPIYFNEEAAQAAGHEHCPIHPMLVFGTVFGLSVEDLSESGGAFLGAEDVEFLTDVQPGDTLYASSVVIDARTSDSRPGKGIVTWETTGRDQHGTEVLRYRRTNIISSGFPEGSIPAPEGYAEDFEIGLRMRHSRSRTVGDLDMNGFTLTVMNTASGHFSEGEMADKEFGQRINFGGLSLSLVVGLATQDTAGQLVRELGLTAVSFTRPVVAGDTLWAATEVLSVTPAEEGTSVVRFRHHGYNQRDEIVCRAERTALVRNRP